MVRGFCLVLCLVACAEDVSSGRVRAEVKDVPVEAVADDKAATVKGEGTTLQVESSASRIGALGAKVTAQHPLEFPSFSGQVMLQGETFSAVAFEIAMDSVTSDYPKLTEHLKTDHFFDVANHPTASFKSTSIEVLDGAQGSHTVQGDMTIRGRTKRISFPATVQVEPKAVRATAEFVVDRQDFGIEYPGRKDDLIQDSVAIQVALVASR